MGLTSTTSDSPDQIGIHGLASRQVIVAGGWRSEKRCSSYLHYLCPSTHLQGLCPKACSQRFAGLAPSGPRGWPAPRCKQLAGGVPVGWFNTLLMLFMIFDPEFSK